MRHPPILPLLHQRGQSLTTYSAYSTYPIYSPYSIYSTYSTYPIYYIYIRGTLRTESDSRTGTGHRALPPRYKVTAILRVIGENAF